MSQLGTLARVLSRTRSRVRAQHALNALAWALLGWLAFASIYALWALLSHHDRVPPLESLALLVAAALVGAAWPVSLEESARRIDVSHALHDRVRAALDFGALPPPQRTRFMEATIQDAMRWADRISAARAVPIALPHVARFAAIGAVFLAILLALPSPKARQPTTSGVKRPTAQLLSADDVDAFRTDLAQLTQRQPLAEELRDEGLRYQRLLEHLMRNELGRAEAIRELLALEKQLSSQGEPAGNEAGEFGELSRALAGASDVLRQALQEQDAATAASEFARMSKGVASGNESELQRLRESLRKLASKRELTDAREARARELENLLKRKQADEGAAQPEEKRLLERQRRELEKLQRDLAEQRKRNRELDKLERDLADLSHAMDANDPKQAERELSEAAQDLERFADQQGEREQREELSRQLSQLRQLMQQSGQQEQKQGEGNEQDQENQQGEADGQGGEGQASLEQMFVQRARGQTGQGNAEREEAKSEGSEGEQPGEGSEGGKPSARLLDLQGAGKPEATLLIPGASRRQEGVSRQQSPSREHDARTLDEATTSDGKTRDSRLTGSPSKGPSRSETILDAADRGFATTDYRKVYTEYHGHAEQVLEQDEIPSGYRFYVRRYFQLIRPRDPER